MPAKRKAAKKKKAAKKPAREKRRLWLMYPPRLITTPVMWELATRLR